MLPVREPSVLGVDTLQDEGVHSSFPQCPSDTITIIVSYRYVTQTGLPVNNIVGSCHRQEYCSMSVTNGWRGI